MNLPQLISQADSNSYYSRSDADKYSAANSAGWYLYTAVMREMRGFFLKFDTSSVVLTPGQSTYTLPPDFSSLVHFAERATATEPWHPMSPISLGSALDFAQQQTGFYDNYWQDGLYGGDSIFGFYGPYLPAPVSAVPDAPQIYQVDIAPAVDVVRMTELAYIAKWLTITDNQSIVMLPDEAFPSWLSLTTANLLDMNSDTQANSYRQRGMTELPMLLSWARQRQVTRTPTVRVFGGY